jgi:hypothetical protein
MSGDNPESERMPRAELAMFNLRMRILEKFHKQIIEPDTPEKPKWTATFKVVCKFLRAYDAQVFDYMESDTLPDGSPNYFKMAALGTLPEGFSQWELKDANGWMVAHWAALFGGLPESFDQLDLTSGGGITVEEILKHLLPALEPDQEVSDA